MILSPLYPDVCDVVLGVDHGLFEDALEHKKEMRGIYGDVDLKVMISKNWLVNISR